MKKNMTLFVGLAVASAAVAAPFQFEANPPRSAGPHVWWHWVNGNVSKAGITADLESMADAGICGAQIIDVGCGIPVGKLRFDTDEWYEHVRFAASEAKRLGLSLTILNCSGFANSGGPWVTPADSMKFTTFSETAAKGPSRFSGVLPRTKNDHGFYRDVAVFAIPAPVEEKLPLGFSYALGFKRTFSEKGTLHVETSKDGATFEKYADIPVWLSYFGVADFARQYVLFPEARDYKAIRATFDGAQQKVEVKDIRLERSARIAGLAGKTFRRREPVTADETLVPSAQALKKTDMIDLTAKMADDGTLVWDVPAGNWTIVRFGYVSTGEKNDPPSENGLGLEVDKLDPAAVARHFDAYCGKTCRKLGALAGKPESGFNAVFVDNIEVCSENWTHGFERAFEKRVGYSIFPYLPVLTGRIVGSLDESERFLWDYRRVIADLFAENYIGTLQRKCHENGLQFAFEPYGNCPSDNLQLGRYVDVPMGEFWAGAGTDTIAIGSGNVKFSASVNHVWGQKLMAAESFTAAPGPKSGRWLTTPWAVKGQCDNAYASGANRIVYHRFAHQPWTDPKRIPGATMGPWGMHFERTQTWWEEGKEFIRYQTRCQNVLQRPGAWRADALFFCGEDAPNAGGNPIAEHNEFALDAGYKYDVCSADALSALKAENGRLVSPGGTRYSLFVLPDRKEMSIRVLKELERFVAGGVKVCYKARPVRAAGLVGYPASDADLARRFAALEPKMLQMTPEQALAKIGLGPDFKVVSGADAKDAARICWMHREVGGEEMFFVGNPSRAGKPVVCAFRVADGEPELWDAESGKSWRPRQVRRNGGCTEVELPFADTGSFFVFFRKGAVKAPVFPVYEKASETPVAGPWTVEFPHGFLPNLLAEGANEVRTFDTLADWSKSDEKAIRYFSGSAIYRKTVAAPQLKPGERLILDLGKVKNFATVTVNGKTYPALWKGPFALDVTSALARSTSQPSQPLNLSIRLTNLWPNRMIGDDFLPDDCTWSGDESQPDRHNVGLAALPDWLVKGAERASGRVTFSTWRHWTKTDKLLESGLLGPVVLRTERPAATVNPGVVLRFDDTHPAAEWQELLDAFDAEGVKASFALPAGLVANKAQEAFLRRAAAGGHEIMDHAHDHTTYSYRCRDRADFDRFRTLPIVAETNAALRLLGFRFAFDKTHPGNFAFRGFVTNGVLVVSPDVAKRLKRPNKIYVPSLGRFCGFFDDPGGHIALKSFYTYRIRETFDVPEGELLLCDHRAFALADDALRFQAERSREAFRRLGLPDPKVWIQPGGWDPHVPADQFRRIYEKEFGYRMADCIPGSSPKWNADPKAPDPDLARFTFRPKPYFDSAAHPPSAVRASILKARAEGRGICLLSHTWVPPTMKGGRREWMDETRALLKWLRANDIPVRTASEMADVLWPRPECSSGRRN